MTDQQLLDAAYEQALLSWGQDGIPIGAVLATPDGTIVARGHNQRQQQGDTTAHGEIDCFRNAGRRRDWHTLTLVTTLSPCVMCTGAALLHRIPRIIIGENRSFMGAEDLLRDHGVELLVLNDERCYDLMQRYIADHPDDWDEDIGIPAEPE
jgi:creatinine deaminase